MNTEDKLSYEIQFAILDVFKEFRRICEDNNLMYFAIGGTCIGAVRHKGFIPWDDDLDIAMPYPDYKKFIEVCKTQLRPSYSIFGPYTCKHYSATYIKLQNHETTFIEEFAVKYPDRYSGIYLDVFPIYGLPKSELSRKILERRCQAQNKLNLRMRYEIEDEVTSRGRLVWKACAPLRAIHNYEFYCRQQEKMLAKYPYDCSDKVIFCWRRIHKKNSNFTYKNIFYYEDFSEMLETPFEDTTIMIPRGYDRYLKMDFGDYMKLPPKEQQISRHPKGLIDLAKPYSFYLPNEKGKNGT